MNQYDRNWEWRAKCDACGWISSLFNLHFVPDPCPKCGEQLKKQVIARAVYLPGVWWNPMTWGRMGWEIKGE